MARPSNKEEKAEQILDAFERCIAKVGVEGATLQLVAEEASMARALLRHHVGNRDALIDAMVQRFLTRSTALNEELLAYLPQHDRIPVLLEVLFSADNLAYSNDILVAEALINAAQTRPALSEKLLPWYQEFEQVIVNELALAFPQANSDDIDTVATGVVGIYFNVYSITGLGQVNKMLRLSQGACEKLISTLG